MAEVRLTCSEESGGNKNHLETCRRGFEGLTFGARQIRYLDHPTAVFADGQGRGLGIVENDLNPADVAVGEDECVVGLRFDLAWIGTRGEQESCQESGESLDSLRALIGCAAWWSTVHASFEIQFVAINFRAGRFFECLSR